MVAAATAAAAKNQYKRRTITGTSRDLMMDGAYSSSNRTFDETLPLPAIPPPSNVTHTTIQPISMVGGA